MWQGAGALWVGVSRCPDERKPRLGGTGLSGEAWIGGSTCFGSSSLDFEKGSKQQHRLSGIYSLGGAAVILDMQFPSGGVSAQPAKGSMAALGTGADFRDAIFQDVISAQTAPSHSSWGPKDTGFLCAVSPERRSRMSVVASCERPVNMLRTTPSRIRCRRCRPRSRHSADFATPPRASAGAARCGPRIRTPDPAVSFG
jgi:hypothetical protein